MNETCAVCGEKLMKVRLFSRVWDECPVTVCMAIDFGGTLTDGDDELAAKIKKHEEHDAAIAAKQAGGAT